ncbi:MAG: alanine--tRNA ligase [Nitrospirae bacterium]|nr:alanine--tRNA ligase [Nitrospirota bacterium]
MTTSAEIRSSFFEYFGKNDHTVVTSSSLIPQNDPTLLFTNAGMVQFKRVFTGEEERSYKRAVSIQKCLRAGGKHNDLENVGFTSRHHTFFEMLGNFSFGDYFKKEAIGLSWEFLTRVLGLPAEKLWVSVYKNDDDAYDLWQKKIGFPRERLVRLAEKDNFWQMGDTGPCGPCSEIIIDQGSGTGCGRPECAVGCDCDRYLELWNLVFMQYEKKASGELTPLPSPSIDTGMGLERISAVVQGVKSNYDSDLFMPLITAIAGNASVSYDSSHNVSIRVIADHIRAAAFLISDGVMPSNEGRGYVLRRIIRRGARHARLIGIHEPFLFKNVGYVIELMKGHYPELYMNREIISTVTHREEEGFINTLEQGMKILDDVIIKVKERGTKTIPGEILFKLYDTYGFPLDITAEIAREHELVLDDAGFQNEMETQRERARRAWVGQEKIKPAYQALKSVVTTKFTGYDLIESTGQVAAIIKDGVNVERAAAGDEIEVVFEKTPFYGESGGQAGDKGVGIGPEGGIEITDTIKALDIIVSKAKVNNGSIMVGEEWVLKVNNGLRRGIARSHTATHMLQAALKQILGGHVKQAGSLVEPDRLRFDFTHFKPLSAGEIGDVEGVLNEKIRDNLPVTTDVMDIDNALKGGATALFGEKYSDQVRVVQVQDFSKELCGGTHCKATGEIGLIKIISESGIASGVRRIEAFTGEAALKYLKETENIFGEICDAVKATREDACAKADRLISTIREQEKEMSRLKDMLASSRAKDVASDILEVAGIKLLSKKIDGMSIDELRKFGDSMRSRIGSGIISVGAEVDGKAAILIMVTEDLTNKFSARDIMNEIAGLVDGRGGGRPEMAQAGGKRPEGLQEALNKVVEVIEKMSKNKEVYHA